MTILLSGIVLAVLTGMLGVGQEPVRADERAPERDLLARAKVWSPTDIRAKDLWRGPEGPGAFAPNDPVVCSYLDKTLTGSSPKFACVTPGGDELKVKYGGGRNGEVFAEVAASRLLWALGFPADRMYPVRVVCRGCPDHIGLIRRANGDRIVDPAAVERKTGEELLSSWHWADLDVVNPAAGGATVAERDGLKLLAVLLQHSDSKPDNQRLVCLDAPTRSGTCDRPFLMVHDLGVTFGRANPIKQQPRASMSLEEWTSVPIWSDRDRCVGNLPGSWQGSLKNPVISEEGRRFLAGLLAQLSDEQLAGMFQAARVIVRPRQPTNGPSGFPEVSEWVRAFRVKQAQIADHQCASRPGR